MKKINKESIKNVAGKGSSFMNEFKSFILKGNVMDMAIGVIIGSAFASIVSALTQDFINPLINGIGGANVAGKFQIYGGQYIDWGHFVTAVINFVIMAFVLFLLLKFVNKVMSIGKKKEIKEEVVKKREEIELLEEIRDLLKQQNKKSK